MLTTPNAEENSTLGITPSPNSRMPWRIGCVNVLPDWKLRVRFLDGLEGVVEMKAFIHSEQAGVFSVLADREQFNQAYVKCGVVTWPGELDLAPDAMYAAIKKSGTWVLQP